MIMILLFWSMMVHEPGCFGQYNYHGFKESFFLMIQLIQFLLADHNDTKADVTTMSTTITTEVTITTPEVTTQTTEATTTENEPTTTASEMTTEEITTTDETTTTTEETKSETTIEVEETTTTTTYEQNDLTTISTTTKADSDLNDHTTSKATSKATTEYSGQNRKTANLLTTTKGTTSINFEETSMTTSIVDPNQATQGTVNHPINPVYIFQPDADNTTNVTTTTTSTTTPLHNRVDNTAPSATVPPQYRYTAKCTCVIERQHPPPTVSMREEVVEAIHKELTVPTANLSQVKECELTTVTFPVTCENFH